MLKYNQKISLKCMLFASKEEKKKIPSLPF